MKSDQSGCRTNAIILAGGNSSRMNFPKPWLLNTAGVSFLAKAIRSFRSIGCQEVVVVLNHQFASGYEQQLETLRSEALIVLNLHPDQGRIHSLQLAVAQLSGRGFTFIHNIDTPEIKKSTLQALQKMKPAGVAKPVFGGVSGHPILVNPDVLDQISPDYTDLREVLREFPSCKVKVNDTAVVHNLNTPDDYKRFYNLPFPVKAN